MDYKTIKLDVVFNSGGPGRERDYSDHYSGQVTLRSKYRAGGRKLKVVKR